MKPYCQRSGCCCHYYDDNKKLKKCKYLVKLSSGKTLCRIYKTRIGTVIDIINGVKIKCGYRTDIPLNYPNCLYNNVTWKDFNYDNVQEIIKNLDKEK
jgi:hypothetical protein